MERAPEPLHGRVRTVEHAGTPLFAGIPHRFEATRYHSLQLASPLPSDLEPIAWAEDGRAMAIAHRTRPQWGVQFHPESIATEHGRRLLSNFRDLTAEAARLRGSKPTHDVGKEPRNGAGLKDRDGGASSGLRLRRRRLDGADVAPTAFRELYGNSANAFWLDSSRPREGSRFSFMGDASGPLGATITYDATAREVTILRTTEDHAEPSLEVRREALFDFMERELARLRLLATDLPFDFDCGFAGYLGYELKADCGSPTTHSSPHPDAALVFADRLVAFDHEQNHTYLLCLHEQGKEEEAEAWLSATAACLTGPATDASNAPTGEDPPEPPRCCSAGSYPVGAPARFRLDRSHTEYLADIATCTEHLLDGESYEICLTNSIAAEVEADPLALYMELRRVNPAPFAAYLRFGSLAVLSSSPERFLSVDRDGGAEAKPIKGTAAAVRRPGRGRPHGRAAADRREEPGREPDDRRPPAQRPRLGLRRRQRRGAAPDGGRELRDPAPAGLHRARAPARRRHRPSTPSAPASRLAR